jgi:hypothetical protein
MSKKQLEKEKTKKAIFGLWAITVTIILFALIISSLLQDAQNWNDFGRAFLKSSADEFCSQQTYPVEKRAPFGTFNKKFDECIIAECEGLSKTSLCQGYGGYFCSNYHECSVECWDKAEKERFWYEKHYYTSSQVFDNQTFVCVDKGINECYHGNSKEYYECLKLMTDKISPPFSFEELIK